MKGNRFVNYFILGVVILAFAVAMSLTINIEQVNAQSPCNDPADPSYPCTPQPPSDNQSSNPPVDAPPVVHTKTPVPTATNTQTITPTPKSINLPISGGVAGSNNPNSELPAIQNPGPLGWIIPIVIIGIGAAVGLTLVKGKRKIGSTGNIDLLPAIQKGGKENMTMTVHDGAEFGGGNESATVTVHDVGDVAPDGALNVREAANNPGSIHGKPPDPLVKPPSPNKPSNPN